MAFTGAFPEGCAASKSARNAPDWNEANHGAAPSKSNVRRGLALKHLPHENEFAAFVAVADAVADHAFAEHGRQLRREVAHLIGMRKQNQFRLRRFDHLLQRDAESIRGVGFEQVVFHLQHFGDVFRGKFVRERRNTFSNHQRAHGARCVFRNLLRRRQRFKTGVVPLPLPLLGDHQNFHG